MQIKKEEATCEAGVRQDTASQMSHKEGEKRMWQIQREERIDLPALRWLLRNYDTVRDRLTDLHTPANNDALSQLRRLQKVCKPNGTLTVVYERPHKRAR